MTDYDKEKELAKSGKLRDRLKIASNPETAPEILYFLAEDIDDLVRQEVAKNPATPRHADVILTRDNNDDIRGDLALKLARVTPHLPSDTRLQLYQLTEQALTILARDQVTKVRKIQADALKDVPNAPAEVIKQLASDKELTVAEPVLVCSPVLNEKDLLQIISSDPIQGALEAIAQRGEVSEEVANIIIKSGDSHAVTYLLNNHKAAIKESDMELVLVEAPKEEAWHSPLVSRPLLSPKSICRLASFVAMNLLDKLQSRMDIDDETLVIVTDAIETRIAAEKPEEETPEEDGVEDEGSKVFEEAKRLMRAGALTQELIEDNLADGNRAFTMAAVSLLSNIDYQHVIKTLTNKKPEAILALCWKAGLSAHMAQQFQMQIARIPTQVVIAPVYGSGDFALSEADLKTFANGMPKLEK